jgi:anti-sigma-K factor RskA
VDIHAYIESGIIESYVLSLTSTEESVEVEKFRTEYVEVEAAIAEFSQALEQHAFENAIIPPPELKAKVLAAIKEARGVEEPTTAMAPQTEKSFVVPLHQTTSWRMIAAASVILFIVSAAANFYLYQQYRNKEDDYEALLSQRETLQAKNDVYHTQLKEWQSAAAMMADTGMAMIKMASAKGKDDAATVFWDKRNKDVFVMVNKLPEPQVGKQYQLWAMVDGQPVDAGILDLSCTSVCKMKNVPRAQAFAITLEREGGNKIPNLKALFVIGNV